MCGVAVAEHRLYTLCAILSVQDTVLLEHKQMLRCAWQIHFLTPLALRLTALRHLQVPRQWTEKRARTLTYGSCRA